ncbi:MAG: lysine--tRNA ligase [Nanoarchaeota archaeon]|nr:lysine--tRNA ligase [Nanoarchaeota archaeon]
MRPEEQLIKQRKDKIDFLISKGVNPYASRFEKKDEIGVLIKDYGKKVKKGEKTRKNVSVAGRVMSLRIMGKASFGDIQDASGRMQFYANEKDFGEKYEVFKKLDIGDIMGIKGVVFKTHKGELSVWLSDFELLTKSLRPLPEKWHGLRDTELRYRQRYVDLIMNPYVKKVFMKRSRIIEAVREFLIKRGFVEVETPILQPIYGGGSARPFDSKLNALNMNVYMRISNELYLKRLIVGGYEKVFEFSADFRNEGIDKTHNPEFLQMETMCAYADYKDSMDLSEEMVTGVVKKLCKELKVNYQGQVIDFKRPWKRISVADAIQKETGINVKIDFNELRKKSVGAGVDAGDCENWGQLVEKIFEERVEKTLINPTIIYDYPADTSPLARKKIEEPIFVERFEVFVNGWEIINSYSELNDPQVLIENWKNQEELKKKGDEEAQVMDEDFVRAMEYGMPPTSGVGLGIDRLVMLLTDSASIRDVIMFPFMRPK